MPFSSPATTLFPASRVRRHVLVRQFGRGPQTAQQATVVVGLDGVERVVDRSRLSLGDAAALVGGA